MPFYESIFIVILGLIFTFSSIKFGPILNISFFCIIVGAAFYISLSLYIDKKIEDKIRKEVTKVIENMEIIGLVNVQIAYVKNTVYLLEVNPRASRTIPFVSKALGIPLARVAAKVMAGKSLKDLKFQNVPNLEGFFVKEAVMPFNNCLLYTSPSPRDDR